MKALNLKIHPIRLPTCESYVSMRLISLLGHKKKQSFNRQLLASNLAAEGLHSLNWSNIKKGKRFIFPDIYLDRTPWRPQGPAPVAVVYLVAHLGAVAGCLPHVKQSLPPSSTLIQSAGHIKLSSPQRGLIVLTVVPPTRLWKPTMCSRKPSP